MEQIKNSQLDNAIADSFTAPPQYRKGALKSNIKDLFTELLGDSVDESTYPQEVVSILQGKINEL